MPYNFDSNHLEPSMSEKLSESEHVEQITSSKSANLQYEGDREPQFHARTGFALVAMFLLNMVQVFGLLGPPAGLSYIEADLNNTVAGTWVPNSLSLVQAVLAPLIASLSDTFQARKSLLVGASAISFIGAAIAPGSKDIYRVIAAQVLIGFGFATVPLAYCIPSEILPRKWRPMAQAAINVAAAIGACSGPLIIGSLTKANPHMGWRNFYWIQMALWGATSVCLMLGYRPPKRHTRLDHLTLWQKISRLDLGGFALLTAGLALILTGLNLGGGLFAWDTAPVLTTIVLGILLLLSFGIYEWRFTETGILHHDLFRGGKNRGRTFAICIGLIFVEGILLFAYVIFYPFLVSSLFETDPFLSAVRQLPFWIAGAISTIIYGYLSTRFRSIRFPMMVGFLLWTGGMVGFATIEPDQDLNSWMFAALSGAGFGAPLILVIAGVQLSTPHNLIATATAATTCSRAIAAAVFTAIFSTAMNMRLETNIPNYISNSVLHAGLPQSSVGSFVAAIMSHNTASLVKVEGNNPAITRAGAAALRQANADGLRIIFIIAAPFGVLAIIMSFFLGDLTDVMTYRVDAPVENLHSKQTGNEKA